MKLIVLLALAPVSAIWYGFTFSVMWGWFVVPTFHVDPLRIPYAIGLAYTIQFLTHQTEREGNEPETHTVLVMAVVKPLVLLTAGWIVKLFV